jgi:formiminotetrahydrofolate cyclodeaminase
MSNDQHLAARRLGDVIDAVASNDVSPGAGTAGAVALALAAACASKAVAVTLKHRPEDSPLRQALQQLAEISRKALEGADDDANHFEDFIHDKDARAVARLIKTGKDLQSLAASLISILRQVDPLVDPSVTSDVTAAQALCQAFTSIQKENLQENRSAAAGVDSATPG